MKKQPLSNKQFVVCIENKGYEASLEKRKIYTAFRDESNDKQNLLRVLDESGEDYLYPADYFVPIEMPTDAAKVLAASSPQRA